MAPRKSPTKLKVVSTPEVDPAPPPIPDLAIPDHVLPEWHRFYLDLVHEVITLRSVATPTDLSMIETAIAHASTEAQARTMAQLAFEAHDYDSYLKMVKLMQAASRGKSGILGSLGLTGDRRGSTNSKRRELGAQNSTAVTGGGKGGGNWRGLI